jgi:hypothetical protein
MQNFTFLNLTLGSLMHPKYKLNIYDFVDERNV